MVKTFDKNAQRMKRHTRVRGKISGTPERPRLNVYRSNANIYAQIIDDVNGVTLVAAASNEKDFEGATGNKEAAYEVVEDGTQGVIRIQLKYLAGKEKVISGLRRVSKPGLRVYAGADELPRVLKGLGIAIISTSKGVMTDKAARANHVGGEVLAFVW